MTDYFVHGPPADEAGSDDDAYRMRASRLPVNTVVTLQTDRGGVEAFACDVSQYGLKILTHAPLEPGPITVKMIGFPKFSGEVRWHGGRHIGIEFFNPIPWEFLTTWVKAHGFGRR